VGGANEAVPVRKNPAFSVKPSPAEKTPTYGVLGPASAAPRAMPPQLHAAPTTNTTRLMTLRTLPPSETDLDAPRD
jgi:hypothetical protein